MAKQYLSPILPPYDPETEDNPLHDLLPVIDELTPRAPYTFSMSWDRLLDGRGFSRGISPIEFSEGRRGK